MPAIDALQDDPQAFVDELSDYDLFMLTQYSWSRKPNDEAITMWRGHVVTYGDLKATLNLLQTPLQERINQIAEASLELMNQALDEILARHNVPEEDRKWLTLAEFDDTIFNEISTRAKELRGF